MPGPRSVLAFAVLGLLACRADATTDAGDDAPPDITGIDVRDLVIPGALHVQGLPVPAKLFVPLLADGPRPLPGVLVLHGSGGLHAMPDGDEDPCSPALEPQFTRWGERLARLGHVVLMPASYDARGFCDRYQDSARIPADFDVDSERLIGRLYDLDAAGRHLCTLPEVDCDRLGLLGFSNGASTLLLALHWQLGRALGDYTGPTLDLPVEPPPPGAPTYSVAVAYYPGCGLESLVHFDLDPDADPEDQYFPATELYIEHGDADPLISDCSVDAGAGRRQLQAAAVARARDLPDPYHITVHPGAGHGFDNAGSGSGDEGSDSARPEDLRARDTALESTLAHLAAHL